MRVSTSLNSRSLSWLSEAETNGGGIFIPINHLKTLPSCSIRRDCRWWNQEGKTACMRILKLLQISTTPLN
ncbi:hypothetical protein [Aetokthonos hydrillicola]|uniref:hypothetical protein n=1 Tax=Aetokthonos hydrillicola TaxID=1550245 RepID=UPI0028779EB4|nr:hypothetical protein [Aetokthonos hydrillicola]